MTDARFGRLTDAPASLVIVGATVVDPAMGQVGVRDMVIRDGRLADGPRDGLEVLDGSGLMAAPGFVDLHAHLREPGAEMAETLVSGTWAAAKGGFTTVCAMPNTDPPPDRPERLHRRTDGLACAVRTVAAATFGRAGAEPSDAAALAGAGAVAVSDDGAAVPDEALGDVLRRCAAAGIPLIEHPEDPAVGREGVMRAGAIATRLGLPGWTPDAEVAVVRRDLEAAERLGARVHLTHLSTPASVLAVAEARERGVPATCDVTPHHLTLTDAWVAGSRRFAWDEADEETSPLVAYDGACRVNPPLPSAGDALELLGLVADGTVDAIATDHAPHPPERKLVPFEEAAPGLIGLETALSMGLAAVEAGRLTLPALVRALTVGPAAVIGDRRSLAAGEPADLVVFDPVARWRVNRSSLVSRSVNTPLIGMELPGVVRLTIAGGRVTYRA